MNKQWSKPIEQIAFGALESKTRVIGISSPTRSDPISQFSSQMAGTFASSGARTILIDLSLPVGDYPESTWRPGEGGIGQSIRPTEAGYDQLQAAPTPQTRLLFSNADLYRQTFDDELRHYSQIVIEMPPVIDGVLTTINPIGPALACNSVIMMCTTGSTTRDQLQGAIDPLRQVGVKLAGIVMNEELNPSLAEELAREARRLRVISPALAAWLERKLLSWSLLQSR